MSISSYLEKRNSKLPLLVIIFFCFVLRRGIFPQIINKYRIFYKRVQWQQDSDGWLDLGENLAKGNGFRYSSGKISADRGPVFPGFLAFIFWIFGYKKGLPLALTMQMVFDTITCWLIWKITLKIFGNQFTALSAAFIWAVYVPAMFLNLLFYSEPIFTFILCLFTLNILYIKDSPSKSRFFIGGALLGLTTLCRPITFYLPLIILPVFIYYFRDRIYKILSGSLMFLFGFCLVLLPWTIRNYNLYHEFIPASSLLGINWYSNLASPEAPVLDKTYYAYNFNDTDLKLSSLGKDYWERNNFGDKNEVERDRIYREAAWELIKQDPFGYLVICLDRLKILWMGWRTRNTFLLKKYGVFAFNLPIIILFLSSFIFFRDQLNLGAFLLLSLIFYNTFGHMLVIASWRYNVPVMPYMIILGAYSLSRIMSKATPADS